MKTSSVIPAALGLAALTLASPASAQSFTIDFEDGQVGEGSILSGQYAEFGVIFSPGNPFGGTGGSGRPYDPDTGMGVTADPDNKGPGIVDPGGNFLLHTLDDWRGETGDAAMTLTFDREVTGITVQFNGVSFPASSKILAFDGAGTQVASAAATATGFSDVSLTGLSGVTTIVLTPGDFDDWVGVDDIRYTLAPVPGPGALPLLASGLGGVGVLLRRRKR